MTITSILFIPAAEPERTPNFALGGVRQASYGVACFLAATLVGAPLAAGVLAGEDILTATPTPAARGQSVVTDRPPPAYVLRLERDPFR